MYYFPGKCAPVKQGSITRQRETENLGYSGSNTREQLCEISDDFREICQGNKHRAALGKPVYT